MSKIEEREKKLLSEWSHSLCFRRDGTPYENVVEFAQDFQSTDRRVAQTKLWWGGEISTVWVGVNHNFIGLGPPLIFETMVFAPTSLRTLDMARYSTETEALAGHQAIVKKWKYNFVKIISALALAAIIRFFPTYR
jgi:hypothetical protein